MQPIFSNGFMGKIKLMNLGQQASPPTLGPTRPSMPDKIVVNPRPAPAPERKETSETMPPEEIKKLREIDPYADKAVDDICSFLHGYASELNSQVKNFKELKGWADAINRILDKNKAIEGHLWEAILKYCDAPRGVVLDYFERRWPTMKWSPGRKPVATPSARPPVKTPGVTTRPISAPPLMPPPVPLQDVATPGTARPYEGAGGPGPVGLPVATPSLPRYTDVATPSTPQYNPDLQSQIDSYWSKFQETGYGGRPPVPTGGGVPTATLKPYQLGPTGGTGTPVPGTSAAPVPSTMCPPGQFWDGTKCRGSVDASAAGLISAAGGMGPSGATMTPGGFAPGGMPSTSVMSGRYPVVNV